MHKHNDRIELSHHRGAGETQINHEIDAPTIEITNTRKQNLTNTREQCRLEPKWRENGKEIRENGKEMTEKEKKILKKKEKEGRK